MRNSIAAIIGNCQKAVRTIGGKVWLAAVLAACCCSSTTFGQSPQVPPSGMPVKMMIINAFEGESRLWITSLGLRQYTRVPGLSLDYPGVACNEDGVCQMTTGMGHTNAAASTMAVTLSNSFDFRRTYFLIAGIAGVNPSQATIGAVAWARYVVDVGIANEFDARELPAGWATGYFGVHTRGPGEKPPVFYYHTELFRLDETLLQKVLTLTAKAQLQDDDAARAYRSKYQYAPADRPPAVIQCDVIASDTMRRGALLGQQSERWMRLLTDGAGRYCVGDQEDTAILNAMRRAAQLGLMDLKRVAVLRAGSDFDRPYPGQTAYQAYLAESTRFGQFSAFANLYNVGSPWTHDVVKRWSQWQEGVPPD
jgi:purine nucleoside permease